MSLPPSSRRPAGTARASASRVAQGAVPVVHRALGAQRPLPQDRATLWAWLDGRGHAVAVTLHDRTAVPVRRKAGLGTGGRGRKLDTLVVNLQFLSVVFPLVGGNAGRLLPTHALQCEHALLGQGEHTTTSLTASGRAQGWATLELVEPSSSGHLRGGVVSGRRRWWVGGGEAASAAVGGGARVMSVGGVVGLTDEGRL